MSINDESGPILAFINTSEAKGGLNDPKHHTTEIFKKFNNRTLKRDDFKIYSLKSYFDRNPNPEDPFISNKMKLLKLKMNEFSLTNMLYAPFPLIGLNSIYGSIHLLFEPYKNDPYEIRIDSLFSSLTKIFSNIFDKLYAEIMIETNQLDYTKLQEEACLHPFLLEFDYPKYYLTKINEGRKIINNHKKESTSNEFNLSNIQHLISIGKTDEVLSILEKYSHQKKDQDLNNRLIVIESNFRQIQRDYATGIMSLDEYYTREAKIKWGILTLLNQ
ncbi:hypothetical protein [Haliscomenobacter hydrossis]|uniref:Effector-associated domain-containing protein n=1 Tax=Haliscomenobacter hydrossis (strain ATCC 27775 / DSM 1100 / LMG 10767 / O) TaxID=760192 RepID=F4KT09_HALH1|nr:hypothetical protein [Haliscomenobacter hydrossis]AEE50079.1 hypothetical protein Halhy_2197 [Haliscomenobacter hydrossis DSM 1100]